MKAPTAQSFPEPKSNATLASKAQSIKLESTKAVRRSYTISQDNDDKINSVATSLTQKKGKPVSASEALRTIIEAYKVKA